MKICQASDPVTNVIQLQFIWQENFKSLQKISMCSFFTACFPGFNYQQGFVFLKGDRRRLRSNHTRWYCVLWKSINGVFCRDIHCL